MNLKYGSQRTYSLLCGQEFASKAECRRGEELALLERGGLITDLKYQVKLWLSHIPKVILTVDFVYKDTETKKLIYEDVKGMETREFRVKRIWLKQLCGIDIILTK